ncbi:hypothetical protein MWU75_06340 [Ornithinimicrobium sp. F0845]|uniref:hypothetical protein n=1 Tax=Ornithinimicrobium sp. F0845 TaxID=2926412 RepID=UPI001FF2BE00|nr:hypothetical protein [Ornithinimicrobium sp. F0845]MCK0111753.1 hypothetical protein [Ornithinimicrobium sp. F0845]
MSTSEEPSGERLSKTTLRDFGPPIPHDERDYDLPSFRVTLSPQEAPIPVLLRHALALIGIRHNGPGEKVAWWVTFTYKGFPCELAHQKFGLRLRIGGDLTEEQADDLLTEMRKKLVSAVRTVEAVLADKASETLNAGNVTVVNQHRQLRRAYEYFRERATNPAVVEDVHERGTSEGGGSWSSFLLGKNVMALNASHDLVAAISAYVSSLEHDLVLALPFLDFDPSMDDLTKIIGDRWGEKWRRVIGHTDPEAVRLRQRLAEVVERWRNPYSHGGFEKGHGATMYLHTPGLGALPVGLSGVRDSPLFSFHSVSETDIEGVFALFDEIDAYLAKTIPHAMEWIDSGLHVRFDAEFMAQVVGYLDSEGTLAKLIDAYGFRRDMVANMDY